MYSSGEDAGGNEDLGFLYGISLVGDEMNMKESGFVTVRER